jgi:osmotically-inducible protein OsmY
MKKILFISFLSLFIFLSGCAPLIIGAIAGGGAYFVTQKDFKKFNNDNAITNQAMAMIKADPQLKHGAHIGVATKNREILLIGEVSSPQQRFEAEKLMQGIGGIKRIYNAITISGPISLLTQSSDGWITTKVKSNMAVTKQLPSGKIKVVTQNGVVYLMGHVTEQHADMATSIARRTAGVQKVVKLFD